MTSITGSSGNGKKPVTAYPFPDEYWENDAFAEAPDVGAMTPPGFDDEMAQFVNDAKGQLEEQRASAIRGHLPFPPAR